MNRHGRVADARLTDRGVALVVKHWMTAIGKDPSTYSGHSLRPAFCHSGGARRRGGPRLEFRADDPMPNCGTMLVRLDTEEEERRLHDDAMAATRHGEFYAGHDSPVSDATWMRRELVEALGWQLTGAELELFRQAALMRFVAWPFDDLEVVQECPGARVYVDPDSLVELVPRIPAPEALARVV